MARCTFNFVGKTVGLVAVSKPLKVLFIATRNVPPLFSANNSLIKPKKNKTPTIITFEQKYTISPHNFLFS